MLIREAMGIFWQTLKDVWEELYSIGLVNLAWLFAWALPVGLGTASGISVIAVGTGLISLLIFPVVTAGMYAVTNRVAHAKTFHFNDFVDAIKKFWWRSLLWMLGNIVFLVLVYVNVWFYITTFEGFWVAMVSGAWLAIGIFWIVMQMYYWPILVEMENPRLFLAWRNCAYLILANPFFAFFTLSFTIFLLALCIVLTLPFIFVGMGIVGLVANNAVLTLYFKFGLIDDPRPLPTSGRG